MKTLREEIRRVMCASCRHMTADEIYLLCRERGVRVSLATVYRNLGIMVREGSLRRVPVLGQADCFDVTAAEHGHKVCAVCGEVSDIDVGDLKAELERRSGLVISDYDLCVRYVCPACREKQKSDFQNKII